MAAGNMTLVRTQLEYAACGWNLHTYGNINIIASVQRQVARFVTHQYDRQASVTSMLAELGWNIFLQTEMFYKVHRGLVNIHMPQDISRTTRPLNSKEEQHK